MNKPGRLFMDVSYTASRHINSYSMRGAQVGWDAAATGL